MAAARPSPRAYLFLEDQDRFIRFLFTRPRTLIGSADDNDIVIRDPTVLPRHAEIYLAGDEYHLIAVAGGKTQVHGRPVEGVHVLQNGDPVQLGEAADQMGMEVTLEPGSNIIPIPMTRLTSLTGLRFTIRLPKLST